MLQKLSTCTEDMRKPVLYLKNKKTKSENPADAHRGTEYRGVSRNGKQWQVLMMIDQEKIYLCSISDKTAAAKLYDIASI